MGLITVHEKYFLHSSREVNSAVLEKYETKRKLLKVRFTFYPCYIHINRVGADME
jgi:hypothetical protein